MVRAHYLLFGLMAISIQLMLCSTLQEMINFGVSALADTNIAGGFKEIDNCERSTHILDEWVN